jgi:hypothetical protein
MQKAVLVFLITVVGFSMLSLSHEKVEPAVNKSSKQTVAGTLDSRVWCPAYADGYQIPRPGDSLIFKKDDVVTYRHCDKCSTGAFLPNQDGVSRCSFCGEKENNIN